MFYDFIVFIFSSLPCQNPCTNLRLYSHMCLGQSTPLFLHSSLGRMLEPRAMPLSKYLT